MERDENRGKVFRNRLSAMGFGINVPVADVGFQEASHPLHISPSHATRRLFGSTVAVGFPDVAYRVGKASGENVVVRIGPSGRRNELRRSVDRIIHERQEAFGRGEGTHVLEFRIQRVRFDPEVLSVQIDDGRPEEVERTSRRVNDEPSGLSFRQNEIDFRIRNVSWHVEIVVPGHPVYQDVGILDSDVARIIDATTEVNATPKTAAIGRLYAFRLVRNSS